MTAPLLFTPIPLRGVTLKNRIVVAPMHQYSAVRGVATDWHLMNVGRFAAGGAGLVFIESTKVERRGCGTVGDLGLWDDSHVAHMPQASPTSSAATAPSPASSSAIPAARARQQRPWEGGRPLERRPWP